MSRTRRIQRIHAVPHNERRVGEHHVVTNLVGDWVALDESDYSAFQSGIVDADSSLYQRLQAANLLAKHVDVDALSARFWRHKSFLFHGPTLHGFVLTERCNHVCQYCHSSVVGMERTDTDMTIDVAERAVDFALSTTSPWLSIEFQGGEPMANWDVLRHVVQYGRERSRSLGKTLTFSLVTNFSLMTEERLDFLVQNRVQICTSLDGPEDLHNQIRLYQQGNSHELTTKWISRVNARYVEMGLDPTLYRVEALPTITRAALSRPHDIIDEFVRVGCRAVFLRRLDPFGFAARTQRKLGYDTGEFLEFYAKALDHAIALNLAGTEVLERNAAIMLCKILGDTEPNYLDLRSPGGAAIGQLGYHPDGGIYSSDEGRMVAAMGDDSFRLGSVLTDSYRDVMQGPTVRALVMASTNLGLPECVRCAYLPWCGQQPEYNYKTQGSIHGRMPDSDWCRKHKGIFDIVMARVIRATPDELEVLRRWTISRTQSHFLAQD